MVKVIGIDIFDRPSDNGIACLDDDQLLLVRTGTTWTSREAYIPNGFQPSVVAVDGPLLPQGTNQLIRRQCESAFIHAPFNERCKPVLSHWGLGLELRRASAEAELALSSVALSDVRC
jgi:hypothetical protein